MTIKHTHYSNGFTDGPYFEKKKEKNENPKRREGGSRGRVIRMLLESVTPRVPYDHR